MGCADPLCRGDDGAVAVRGLHPPLPRRQGDDFLRSDMADVVAGPADDRREGVEGLRLDAGDEVQPVRGFVRRAHPLHLGEGVLVRLAAGDLQDRCDESKLGRER